MKRHKLMSVVAFGFTALALATCWPLVARAAEPDQKVVRLGFVGPASPSSAPHAINALWERLSELGWVEGKNLIVERRWAEGRNDRLPALFGEVLALEVDILVTYSTGAGIAAKKATSIVPIVDAVMAQPVQSGLAESLSRPGGNLTGLSLGWGEGIGTCARHASSASKCPTPFCCARTR